MGWGVDFQADIFLSHQDYQGNIYQVEGAIESCNEEIEVAKQEILMYCSATPKDLMIDEDDNPISTIRSEVSEKFNIIKENIIKLYQLELYKEYLEELNKKK